MSEINRNVRQSPSYSQASESLRESNITQKNIKQKDRRGKGGGCSIALNKEVSKQKPSELAVESLTINEGIEWHKASFKISTKIHYGKKLFIFEIQE